MVRKRSERLGGENEVSCEDPVVGPGAGKSIQVGMQNSGLGTVLARTHIPLQPGAAATCAISAVYHCLIGSFLASVWRAKRRQETTRRDPEGAAGSSE